MKSKFIFLLVLLTGISISINAQLKFPAEKASENNYLTHYEHLFPFLAFEEFNKDVDIFIEAYNVTAFVQENKGLFSGLGSTRNLTKKSFTMELQLGSSTIQNTTLMDDGWESSAQMGGSFNLGYSIRMRRLLSVGIGIGFYSYANKISNYSLFNTIKEKDDFLIKSETVTLYPLHEVDINFSYNNLVESNRVYSLSVPIFIEFGNSNTDKASFYSKIGVLLSLPVYSSFKGEGLYSVSAYYSDFNLTIDNVPALGYVSNKEAYDDPQSTEIQSIQLSAIISAGFSFPVKSNMIMRFGVEYIYGFTDLSKSYVHIDTPGFNVNHTLMQADKPVTGRSIGLSLGIHKVISWY